MIIRGENSLSNMNEVVQLLSQLVCIESVNPSLQERGAGELMIARFIANWFHQHGFVTHWLENTPKRPSVVGIARGSPGPRSLMFNGHIDTVGLSPFDGNPLIPQIRNGCMFGRGTFDMKSGVAAMMIAAKRAKEKGLSGDLIVACVSDEEHASLGTEEVLRHFRADAAIVTEPSQLELTIAHKGFVWFEITVFGKAAHGSRPDLGIDAIVKMGKFLTAIDQYQSRLVSRLAHPTLKHASVHASLIEGGQEWSSYPAECRIKLERRLLPQETADQAQLELEQILSEIAAQDRDFRYELTRGLYRQGIETARTEPIVSLAAEQVKRRTGVEPIYRGEGFWTDAALLVEAGIPSFLLGVKGGGAHCDHEYVELESVSQLTDILESVALEYLNGDRH